MSVDVTVEQRIARDRETVARFAMDPANDTRWIGALRSVRVLTDGPVGPGTQVERVAGFLGRRIEYVNEITALEPGRRLAMRSVRAPFPMAVEYAFEDAGDGATLARICAGGDTGRYYALAGPMLSLMVRRGIARDLKALKRALDG
jgi:Polyketide cyclase / dehydrase and lipid transport